VEGGPGGAGTPLHLTFDHRLVDGAPAARFLQQIKRAIELPFVSHTRLSSPVRSGPRWAQQQDAFRRGPARGPCGNGWSSLPRQRGSLTVTVSAENDEGAPAGAPSLSTRSQWLRLDEFLLDHRPAVVGPETLASVRLCVPAHGRMQMRPCAGPQHVESEQRWSAGQSALVAHDWRPAHG
jgi:hypothetical protein